MNNMPVSLLPPAAIYFLPLWSHVTTLATSCEQNHTVFVFLQRSCVHLAQCPQD